MWEKLTTALLTKWLTDANIKLSIPVILTAFILTISWQAFKIGEIAKSMETVEDQISQMKDSISIEINKNNVLLFEAGQSILETWLVRFNQSQKMIIDYIDVSEREKKRMLENIDIGMEEVLNKSEMSRHNYMLQLPDSLGVASKKIKKNP